MKRNELLERLDGLNCDIWKERIPMPHKPLLVLWALKRIEDGHPERLASFEGEVERPMRKLLERFNYSDHIDPARPFWHLQSDEVWEIPGAESLPKNPKGFPLRPQLKLARGGFRKPIHDLLCADPTLVAAAAQTIINRYFPRPLHENVRKAIGLRDYGAHEPGLLTANDEALPLIIPDRVFRREVLQAYEERCAICDHDIRLEGAPLDLVAAHIRSHESGGPDEVPNGLALCGSHDAALKSGAIGLDPKGGDFVVLVSDQLKGQGMVYEMFQLFGGRPLRPPQEKDQAPNPEFVEWHRRQVFRGAPLR